MQKLNKLATGIKSGKLSGSWVAVDSEDILAIAEAFRALERRAEAADAALKVANEHAEKFEREMYLMMDKAEAAEAKLADLAKQEPYAFGSKWTDMNTEGRHFSGSIFNNAWGDYTKPLFTRPAPAISLAELVPDEIEGTSGRFRKRPVVIEAVQWTGDNLHEVIAFTDGPTEIRSHHAGMMWENYRDLVRREGLKIYTLEGVMNASVGDWIIKGVKGELYPCKPDIFLETYEQPETDILAQTTPSTNMENLIRIAEKIKDTYLCEGSDDWRELSAILRDI